VLRNIDGIAHIELDEEDVVRHKLVKSIIKAYNKEDEKNQKAKEASTQQLQEKSIEPKP
jgi:phosphate starvation-inducible PhoH-like protein